MTPDIEKAAKELNEALNRNRDNICGGYDAENPEEIIANFLTELIAQERAKVWEEAAKVVYKPGRTIHAAYHALMDRRDDEIDGSPGCLSPKCEAGYETCRSCRIRKEASDE